MHTGIYIRFMCLFAGISLVKSCRVLIDPVRHRMFSLCWQCAASQDVSATSRHDIVAAFTERSGQCCGKRSGILGELWMAGRRSISDQSQRPASNITLQVDRGFIRSTIAGTRGITCLRKQTPARHIGNASWFSDCGS